jgi:hypothetical protein
MSDQIESEQKAPLLLNIQVSVEKLNLIIAHLGKAPFDTVADVILDIRQQALQQLHAMAEAQGESEPQ